jgi:putative MATE family efflux protein
LSGKVYVKTSVKYREIWLIAYPIIIGSVAQNLLNITDTAFLGRVGQVALGAGAIGGVFYLVSAMLAWGFGIGSQIIIARRNGEKSYSEIGRTFQHGFYFQLPLTLALFSLMQFFSGDIMKHIISSEAVFQSFLEYIRYRSYGIFFAGINMLFTGFYIGITRTKIITWTTILMASVNGILDYGLIFGNFGLPEMGIGGAALASSIAEFSGTVFFVVYTIYRLDGRQYRLFHRARFDEGLYKRMIRVAFPVMMQNALSMASWLAFFLLIEKLGERALAVSNIIRSFYVILMIPMWGFGSATNSLVSNLIGRGRQEEVVSLVMKIVRLSAMGVLFIVTLGTIFPGVALKIYTTDPELISASLPALYVVNVAAFLLAVAFILFSAVSGTGKTQISFLIEVTVLIFYLITAFILADVLRLQVYLVWMTEYVYAIFLGIISYLYLKSGKWKSSHV